MNSHRNMTHLKKTAVIYLKSAIAIGLVIVVLFPLVWLLLASVKTTEEVQQLPIRWLPQNPTLEPILQTWFDTTGYSTEWTRYFFNTLKITVITTLLVMTMGTMAGYGLARFQLPGTGLILAVFLIAQLFTGPALMIPIYVLLSKIGLYDTHTGLILVYLIFKPPLRSGCRTVTFRPCHWNWKKPPLWMAVRPLARF